MTSYFLMHIHKSYEEGSAVSGENGSVDKSRFSGRISRQTFLVSALIPSQSVGSVGKWQRSSSISGRDVNKALCLLVILGTIIERCARLLLTWS